MACGCKKRTSETYVWTSEDGTQSVTYNTKVEAQAKVIRKGGSWEAVATAPVA